MDPNLEGGEAGPALRGRAFATKWSGKPVAELYEQTRRTMPVTQPGGLTRSQYSELVALVLTSNAMPVGELAQAVAGRFEDARHGMAASSRRCRQHQLFAAGPDRRGQCLAAEGRLALALGQFRRVDLAESRGDAR